MEQRGYKSPGENLLRRHLVEMYFFDEDLKLKNPTVHLREKHPWKRRLGFCRADPFGHYHGD